jgi:hypothetical protein
MSKANITSLAALALALLCAPASAQQIIQYIDQQGYGYRTEPLYPYVAQPSARPIPYVSPKPAAQAGSKIDPALVAELRKRGKPNTVVKPQEAKKPEPEKKISKTVVVREKPIVRKTYRVVEHPPIVVQRELGEDQVAAPAPSHAEDLPPAGRVIRAEAEVMIIGPDKMSIRLYRKRDGSDANAKAADKPKRKRDARAEIHSKIR